MRIALVYDTVYPVSKGGVEKRVAELGKRLAGEGWDVAILAPGVRGENGNPRRDGVAHIGVSRVRDLYTRSGRRAIFPALAHAVGVWRWVRRDHFDVVDCQTPAFVAALAAWLARLGTPTRLVVTWHEAWGRDWLEEFGTLGHVGRLLEYLVARLPATHLAVSQQVADTVKTLGPSPLVVPPGIDSILLASNGPESSECDILFVGRLVPTKNLGLLIRATSLLVDAGLIPNVVVVGEGPARSHWVEQARDLGVGDNVQFLGPETEWIDVMNRLRSAKILALPSVREGYGMVALEAAACGVPVVTVDHRRNAARHVVQPGVTGLCVPPEANAYAEALRILLEDEGLRTRMGRQARAWAQGFDWDHVAGTTRDIYLAEVG